MRQTILSVASKLNPIDNAIAFAQTPWIFPSRRNPRRFLSRVNNAHDRLCEKAQAAGVELNLVLYDFRHTFATRMAEEGIDLATLAKILGHSSIRVVKRYGHPFIRRLSTRRALCSGTKRLRWRGPRPCRPSGKIGARFFITFRLNPRGPNHARVQAGRGRR